MSQVRHGATLSLTKSYNGDTMNKLIQFTINTNIKEQLVNAISNKNGYRDTITIGVPDTTSPHGDVAYEEVPNPETREEFFNRILEDIIIKEYISSVVDTEKVTFETNKRAELSNTIDTIKQAVVIQEEK